MSMEQLETVRGILRDVDLGLAGPVGAARANFEDMLANLPVPDEVSFEETIVGGVPGIWSSAPEIESGRVLVYAHGGAFTVGSAHGYRALWSGMARSAGARGLGLDYRLAPEHRFPAPVEDLVAAYDSLLDDGHPPGSIGLAGDSAGAGLVVSLLVAARDAGLPMPAAAVCLSPWVDLECAGASMTGKAEEDLSLAPEELMELAVRYLDGASRSDPLASPINANLTGLPPLLILAGSCEILLDDATRLAAQAAADGVRTTLEVWPQMPHVWPLFGFILSEGQTAAAAASAFLRDRYAERGS